MLPFKLPWNSVKENNDNNNSEMWDFLAIIKADTNIKQFINTLKCFLKAFLSSNNYSQLLISQSQKLSQTPDISK